MSLRSLFSRRPVDDPTRIPESQYVESHAETGATIDVRTAAEYSAAHIRGAKNLDISSPDFAHRVQGLDKGEKYYLYCRSGSRSQKATEYMRSQGFDAYNVGGLAQLAAAGADIYQT